MMERTFLRWLKRHGAQSHFCDTPVGRTHTLTIDGQGKLPPVLLLHGFSAWGGQMAPLFLRLLPHVQRIVAPDLMGHGFSDMPEGGMNPDNMRVGLEASLDAVHPEPSLVFGNSMGGFVAVRMNTDWPQRVLSLALASPGGAPMTPEQLVELRQGFVVDRHAQAVDFIDRVIGRHRRLHHLYALDVRRRLRKPEMQGLLQNLTPADLLEPSEVTDIDKPVIFVWGQADGILPDHSRRFFTEHLPGHAEVHEPPGWGHSPYFDRPKELTEKLLTFWAQTATKSPAKP